MRLIVFDLDHTLLKANSSYQFGAFLYRNKFFSSFALTKCLLYYGLHQLGVLSIHTLHQKSFRLLFQGRSLSVLSPLVQRFLDQELDRLLDPLVLKHLESARQRGDRLMLLSASPDFLVRAIAKKLQIECWHATVYQTNKAQCLIALSSVLDGQQKLSYIQQMVEKWGLSASRVTMYSDSCLDLPALQWVGKAVGVRPDARLKHVCLKHGWEILI